MWEDILHRNAAKIFSVSVSGFFQPGRSELPHKYSLIPLNQSIQFHSVDLEEFDWYTGW